MLRNQAAVSTQSLGLNEAKARVQSPRKLPCSGAVAARGPSLHGAEAPCETEAVTADLRGTARPLFLLVLPSACGSIKTVTKTSSSLPNAAQSSRVRPNPSVNPRPTTAGTVSLACGQVGIFTVQAYSACLRGRGYLER